MADSTNKKSCLCNVLPAAVLPGLVFFIGNAFVATDHNERVSKWEMIEVDPLPITQSDNRCKDRCRPHGTDSLPKGIIRETSNLEMRPLWGFPEKKGNAKALNNLLAIAVGIKQKENVNEIVEKFSSNNFTIMLFHYDGIVDEWNDLPWSERALHVSVANQTKWWFAKRFLHPDIVAEYDYIFLWDEDLGVENFNPRRYISIVQEEGLEISQPALDLLNHRCIIKSLSVQGEQECTGNGSGCSFKAFWMPLLAFVVYRGYLHVGLTSPLALRLALRWGAFIAHALIFICSICWWKRRQNILRAQKLAARDAPYAKARTHFVHDVQMTRPRIQDQARVAAEIGPR